MKSSAVIEYVSGDEKKLGDIKQLWEKLNEHHLRNSRNFKEHYASMTFAVRKKDLLEKAAKGEMRIVLARDKRTGKYVGYCISSVSKKKEGEIDSIFVLERYRHNGIGESLMEKSLAWMDEKKAASKKVVVANGNEDAFVFYSGFGFLPRATILVQKR